jgi:Mg2+/Co2+ transporter CorB
LAVIGDEDEVAAISVAASPLFAIVALVALWAFFSATETALLSVNRLRIRHQGRLGNRSARLADKLLAHPERLAGTTLLCKTIVTIGASAQTALFAYQSADEPGVVVAMLILIVTALVVAEIAPRACGTLYAESMALPAAWIYTPLVRVLYPVVQVANALTNGLLHALGLSSRETSSHLSSREALRKAVTEAGIVIPQQQQRMLSSLLDLESVTVEDIMIPRNEIASVDISEDWDTILELLRTTPHTRLPVCEQNLDNIIGILHMKKVAHSLVHGDMTRDILRAMAREREAYFVPAGTSLSTQLQNFQNDRRRIALVVDEYGDILGLVTLEDILEEIVGEFTSDPSSLHKDIHRDTDGSYVVSGTINVRVLNRTLGWQLPTDGPRTLNGLILEYLENIPEPGTRLQLGNLSVEILQAADHAVKTARIRPEEETKSNAA